MALAAQHFEIAVAMHFAFLQLAKGVNKAAFTL